MYVAISPGGWAKRGGWGRSGSLLTLERPMTQFAQKPVSRYPVWVSGSSYRLAEYGGTHLMPAVGDWLAQFTKH